MQNREGETSPPSPSPTRSPQFRDMGSPSSPPPAGFVPDLATRRLMSVNEKRVLVRKWSKCQLSAPEQLQGWTRREITDVLCAVLGKKRKKNTFSSVTKHRMLDLLFKVVNGESPYPRKYKKRKSKPELNALSCPLPFKRQRKNDSSSLLPVIARTSASTGVSALTNNAELCQNSACRATINPGDKFCKRCSCCICFKYDDNKDPTLWLFCNSDQPLQEDSCGFSCHLECAIEDERSGIQQSGQSKKLDTAYYCTQCWKQNDLLGCLEKQLLIAKNARRLDVLCHRIFLSHKILISTKRYLVLHDIVDTAMKKLEAEVGPITGIRDMGHGLVCRLPIGVEVQKLCLCAMEAVQSLFFCSLTADLQIQRSCITPCSLPTSKSQTSNIGDVGEAKICGAEKSPEQEIPRSNAQADLLRNSSSLMVYNRGILKQNLDMIFTESEIPTRAYTENMLENSQSLLDTIPIRTENRKGDSGKSFEKPKSSDHVPQSRHPDVESSSRFEDTRHENGPDSCTTVQTSLHMESSNLMLNDRETFQQTLNADVARLENSSDAHNENELACKKTGDDIKSGNGISATSNKLKTCNHIPETGPLHVQREAIAHNQAAPGQDRANSVSPSFLALEDQVNQLNKRVEEASRAFELEKTVVENASLESDMLTEELKIREEHLMLAPDFILSNFTQLQFFAHQIRAEVIRMEKGNPSVEDILGGMDAQIRVLKARILMIGNLENSARDAIERFLRDFLVKIRVMCPDVDLQSLIPESRDGDYRKVCDEVQPIVVELSKKVRLVTVSCDGDPGNILEEVKSGDHVLQNGCSKAETDPRSSSCKKSSRRFEDGEQERPADPNTTVQTTLHRVSDLVLNSTETFQQNLNADAASLENASDVPSEYELAGSQKYSSPLPIAENEIRYDKGISATGSELKADYLTAQTGPLKPETEPESSSNKTLSGKPDEISHEDGHSEASLEYYVKVIRSLECEGCIEASFRVKFLTWFCLQATPHERRIVCAHVDTRIGDSESLAAQLTNTFSDAAYNKRLHRAPSGFCWDLWH